MVMVGVLRFRMAHFCPADGADTQEGNMFRRILRALGLIRGEEKPVAAPVTQAVVDEAAAEPLMSIDDQILALRAKYDKAYPAKQKKRHHKQRLRA
jgi:hypothetical protein